MDTREDPMDIFSHPYKKTKLKLGTLFYMKPRRNPDKPGRELFVAYDDRFPIIEGFKTHYAYYVRFFEKGNQAGNHYHKKKQELFIPIIGSMAIELEDIATKETEQLTMRHDEYCILHVGTEIAHKVTANEPGSVQLVMATSPNNDGDEFPYKIPRA